MTDKRLQSLAHALTADPPRPVDRGELASVDREELAEALRRAVADLPPAEQRARLARAFAVLAQPETQPEAQPEARPESRPSAVPVRSSTGGSSLMRMSTLARAGVVSGVLVVSLVAGVLAGQLTSGGGSETARAASDPVPVLAPVASGAAPSAGYLAGLLPPDPEVEAAAVARAKAEHGDRTSIAASGDATGADGGSTAAGDSGGSANSGGSGDSPGIAGYADGSGYFGGDSATGTPTTAGRPTAGTSEGSGSDGAGDSGDGSSTAGTGGAGDDPGLIDLCAGEDPPAGCEGVGGTVEAAIERAFQFNYDPQAVTYWPTCAGRRRLEDGEFLFELLTTNLGRFTIRYRVAGSSGPYTEVTGESPDIWRSALDDGSATQVTTCIPARRPDSGPVRLDVDITGAGIEGSGTDHFAGVIDLAEAAPVAHRREDRPQVRVEAITSSTLQATVPVGRGESASVSLVKRTLVDLDPCVHPNPRTTVDATPYRPASVTPADGPSITLDWTAQRYRASATEAGAYAVCVSWYDDGDPPRLVERATVPVDITGLSGAEVLLGGYGPAVGSSGQPDRVTVTARTGGGGECGTRGFGPEDYVASDESLRSDVLCGFDGAPGYLGVQVDARFGDQTLTSRALLPVPESCDRDSNPHCTTWYQPRVTGTGRAVVGGVAIGIRLDGGGPGSMRIGEERPELTGDHTVGPRVRWRQVSATPDPDAPARRALVSWASTEPARVLVTATAQHDRDQCPQRRSERSTLSDHGRLRIDGLCPGIGYYVSLDLIDEAGHRRIYDVWNPLEGLSGVDIVRRSATVEMQPLPTTYDYRLTFRLTQDGRPFGTSLVPLELNLAFPDDRTHDQRVYQFSQFYDGRARLELDCSGPGHYSRSGSGVPLDLTGGQFDLAESRFLFESYYPVRHGVLDTGPPRRCPSLANQVNQTYSDPSKACGFTVSLGPVGASNSVENLLSGGTAQFIGTSRCRSNDSLVLTANLTVQLRETRTLRGHT